jgi:hypothetical protein
MRRSTRNITASKKIVENGDSKAPPKTDVKRKETGKKQEQRRHGKPSKKNKRSASPPVNNNKNVLPDRPIKKAAPARSRAQEKRSQAVAADLFGSDSSSDDESIQDLCSTSSDDDNANGKIHSARKTPARKKPLVEESTDPSSDSEDEDEEEESDLAAFSASASDSEEEESEEEEEEQPQAKYPFIKGWSNNGENDREEEDATSDEETSE